MNNQPETLVIVDAQRGFMPSSEGVRLGLEGFGQLGVEGGERIVENINKITTALARTAGNIITTTQDWHPQETAHFSTEPNYIDTWPVHCVKETDGAKLHPDLLVANGLVPVIHFVKGDTACHSPADDDSYTGALAYNQGTEERLPEYLKRQGSKHVYVTGLALGDGGEHPLCVDSTARDLLTLGFEVTLMTDAVEAVFPGNREICFKNLAALGIRLALTDEILRELT